MENKCIIPNGFVSMFKGCLTYRRTMLRCGEQIDQYIACATKNTSGINFLVSWKDNLI